MTEIFEDVHFNFTATDYTVVLIAKRNETVLSSVPVVLKRSTGRSSGAVVQLINFIRDVLSNFFDTMAIAYYAEIL